MSGFEWFLLVVVVIAVPLIVAIAVTLWTLEQARMRNRKNRGTGEPAAGPVKRRATREADDVTSATGGGAPPGLTAPEVDEVAANRDATTGARAGVSREI